MVNNVVPLRPVPPLELESASNHQSQGSVFLKLSRGMTPEEFKFFRETTERTLHLMRGIEFK